MWIWTRWLAGCGLVFFTHIGFACVFQQVYNIVCAVTACLSLYWRHDCLACYTTEVFSVGWSRQTCQVWLENKNDNECEVDGWSNFGIIFLMYISFVCAFLEVFIIEWITPGFVGFVWKTFVFVCPTWDVLGIGWITYIIRVGREDRIEYGYEDDDWYGRGSFFFFAHISYVCVFSFVFSIGWDTPSFSRFVWKIKINMNMNTMTDPGLTGFSKHISILYVLFHTCSVLIELYMDWPGFSGKWKKS